jgi:hypothetical protein
VGTGLRSGGSHIICLRNISASVIVDTIPSEGDHTNNLKNDPRTCCARTAQPGLAASGENLAADGLFHSGKFSRRPFMARPRRTPRAISENTAAAMSQKILGVISHLYLITGQALHILSGCAAGRKASGSRQEALGCFSPLSA